MLVTLTKVYFGLKKPISLKTNLYLCAGVALLTVVSSGLYGGMVWWGVGGGLRVTGHYDCFADSSKPDTLLVFSLKPCNSE